MAACRAVLHALRAGPEINANIRVAQMVPPIECQGLSRIQSQGVCDPKAGVPPLPCPPSPLPAPHPSPSLPVPPLPLEVGPLKTS